MSDLAATGCGCGGHVHERDNCSCNVLIWILILSCACGGDSGLYGGSLFGGGCDDGCGCHGCNNWIWIIILIALIG